MLRYANEQLGLFDDFDLDSGHVSMSRSIQVAARLWSIEPLIDTFLAENPYKLSKIDLGTIREWRDFHITDVFVVTELSSGYCYLTGDSYSFSIMGISQEIDEIIPFVPAVVLTTLLPFEGKIIFHGFFLVPREQHKIDDPETLYGYHHAAVAAHGLIATAEDMKQASCLIRKDREKSMWIEQIGKFLAKEGADPPKAYEDILENALLDAVVSEHQSLLTENQRLREEQKMLLIEVFSRLASLEPPCRSLEGLLARLPKDILLSKAKGFKLKRYASLKKQELVDLLARHYRIVASDYLFGVLIDSSEEEREFFARLVQEGGTLRIPVEDLAGEAGSGEPPLLIAPAPFCVNLFFDQEAFVYTMPQEYVDAYTRLDPEDIENAVLLKRAMLKGVYFFVDTCGMIAARSYYDWFDKNVFPDFGWEFFLSTLVLEADDDDHGFELFFHEGTNTEYLVNSSLMEDYYAYADDLDEESAFQLASFREYLLEQHSVIKRKDYSREEVLFEDPFEHFLSLPGAVAVAKILDRYLPERDHGSLNTEQVMHELFTFIRWGNEPEDLERFFRDAGLTMRAITTSGILGKAATVYGETPIWEFNGWTIRELEKRKKQRDGQRKEMLPRQVSDEHRRSDFRVIEGGLSAPEKRETVATAKVGRNEPCPCKSGKKYKHCCGKA